MICLAAHSVYQMHVLSCVMLVALSCSQLMKEIDDLTKQERNKISVNDKKKGAAGPGLHRLRPSEGERNILHRDDPLYRAENASQQVDSVTLLFADIPCFIVKV